MPCHWDPPEPTIQEELELGLIDLTRYLNNGRHITKPTRTPQQHTTEEKTSTTKKKTKRGGTSK
jgi:hypothetical protein